MALGRHLSNSGTIGCLYGPHCFRMFKDECSFLDMQFSFSLNFGLNYQPIITFVDSFAFGFPLNC